MHDNMKVLVNEYVYEPAEDSYILAKTVKELLTEHKNRDIVFVEIGSGSGYVSIYLLITSKRTNLYGILTDISPCAAYASWSSAKSNDLDMYIDVIQCYSAQCFRGSFASIVFFNPPYIPVEEFDDIGISWSGGYGGIEVWKEFFSDTLHICLRNRCIVTFIFSSLQSLARILDTVLGVCSDIEIYKCSEFFYEAICSIIVRC